MGDDAGGNGGDGLRWLTYAQMAVALRIKPASARRLAQRKPWPRRQNNRGEATVGVPVDVLPSQAVAGDVAPDVAPGVATNVTGDAAPDAARTIAALAEHIARLGRELETLRVVADAATGETADLRAQLEAARLALADAQALKTTLAAMTGDRDRWHAEATRPILARLFGRRAA